MECNIGANGGRTGCIWDKEHRSGEPMDYLAAVIPENSAYKNRQAGPCIPMVLILSFPIDGIPVLKNRGRNDHFFMCEEEGCTFATMISCLSRNSLVNPGDDQLSYHPYSCSCDEDNLRIAGFCSLFPDTDQV